MSSASLRKAREQRWKDPDWTCPRCDARNFAVRSACRLCGFDPAVVIEMESGAAEPYCHSRPKDQWCDNKGPGGFMGHTCHAPIIFPLAERPNAVSDLNRIHADYLAERMRADSLEKELAEARKTFLTSTAIQAAEVEEARKANSEWAAQDVETARQTLVVMAERDKAVRERDRAVRERDQACERLSAMCLNRWLCYGLKRDDGAMKWYVRDRDTRITDGWDTPEQAIDWAIEAARIAGKGRI